jgi:predicted RNase H-like HicB family nuclease
VLDKYSSSVYWSEEDQCFIAVAPEINGLNAFGDTRAEAIEQLEIAKELLLDAWKEHGIPLPEPTILESYSGQVRLRMPTHLHASLANSARQEGTSLNTYIVTLLAENNALKTWNRFMSNTKFVCPADISPSEWSFHPIFCGHSGQIAPEKNATDSVVDWRN